MADGQDSKDCKDIPAILAGHDALTSVHTCSDKLFYNSYQALSPKVVKLETTDHNGNANSGTAFFVQDGTHLVTSAHAVMHSAEIHVNYQGKKYPAVMEKLDDINDLAELKVLNLDSDTSRAQKVGSTPLIANEHVIAVGVPGIDNQDKYLSPGVLLGLNKLDDILRDPKIHNPEADHIQAAFNSGDPVLKQTAQDVANSPRLVINQGARPGQSGSPIDDASGNLVGVVTAVNGNNATIDVPYTKVQDMLNRPESKFDFNYGVNAELALPSTGRLLSDAAGAGLLATAFLGKGGRLVPAAYGALGAVSLVSDLIDRIHPTSDKEKHRINANILNDATMITGGMLLASETPLLGRKGTLVLMGCWLATRAFLDSVETHPVLGSITSKNGDTHKPWNY